MTIADEQADAARALYERGVDVHRVERVLLCRPLNVDAWEDERRPCKASRVCPQCAERRARRDSRRMIYAGETYAGAMAVLIRAPSRTRLDLPAALRRMTSALAKIRRRAWFVAGCAAGTAAIELPLTRDQMRWNLHMHAVLDLRLEGVERDAWIERAAREWVELVGPGGVWSHEDLRDRVAFARYAVKVGREKSTVTSDLPAWLAAHVDQALRRRRLVRSWRSGARKERR